MKKGILTILLFGFLFGFTNCEMEKSNIVYNKQYIDEIKAAKKAFMFYLLGNNVPGGTVAVMKDGKIIYSEGIGLASKDLEVPVTRETKFRIGQISELFTSFIYLRMVEEGTLNPDSLIQHYFSNFPEKEFPISLRQLADQTSGLRDAKSKEFDSQELNISLRKGIDKFKNDTLFYMPGFVQTDCMFQYNLLGAIMEKATKKNFNKILKDYVTDTLALANTVIDDPFITIKGRTNFYDYSFISQTVNATFRDMRYKAPSQGILSNAEDLVKFGNAVFNSNILSDKSKEEMFKPAILYKNVPANITNGWLLMYDQNESPIYGRRGEVTGGNSALIVYPEYDLIVAFTTNINTSNFGRLIFDISKHFTPKLEDKKE
ncbi:MAG: beta-lactamase family protein, partial [Draconibacterium sp.]|nr:beta-lactamase family protein [Bacteroidales bacterium]MCK5731025.1 beta-lactamase family protein [Draconibacterium sp.]